MQMVKNTSSIVAAITASTAPNKRYSDLTPPINEFVLLFAPLSAVLSVLFGVSVLVLSSPENKNVLHVARK